MLRRKGALVHTPSLSQNNKQNDTAHIKQHAGMQKKISNDRCLREGTQNIKVLQQLSEMKDCSSGALSDERSRPCGWADLAPQSHTRGVTFFCWRMTYEAAAAVFISIIL